jgi:hypothetical protein
MAKTISSAYTAGITLTTTTSNPVTIKSTGRISVTSGVALTGNGGSSDSWTIANSGTIIGAGDDGKGIYLGHYQTYVTNAVLTNMSGGLISAPGYAVQIAGPGSVTNLSGGTISGGNNAVFIEGGLGTVVNAGVILAGNVGAYSYNGGSMTNLSGGTISGGNAGVWFQNAPGTFTNFGVVIGSNSSNGAVLFNYTSTSNRLIAEPGAVFTGNIHGGTGVMELASAAGAGTVSGFGTGITNFNTLQFDAGAKWTVTGNTASSGFSTIAITGFTAQDTIDLTGFAAVSETFANNALVLTDAATAHATLHIQGAFVTGDFQLSSYGGGGTTIIECFAAGTRIDTPEGTMLVEDLAIGTMVRAHFAGSAPIQWIGRRHVDCKRHPDPRKAWPVRVRAGAFGPGRPRRDLLLSPNHAVYLDGDLIPIGLLINDTSIIQLQVDEVAYYHLELAQHDLLTAEGLLSESYLAAGDRSNFVNDHGPMRLFPDFASPAANVAALWETKGCAALVIRGPVLESVRRRVNELAAANLATAKPERPPRVRPGWPGVRRS